MVTGTFDILHKGHLYFLGEAKKHGDELYVVIARDETVKQVKGKFPENDEKTRKNRLEELEVVDNAVLGHLGDKHKVLEDIKPDIICLGYDQKAFTWDLKQSLKKKGIDCKIVRIKSYKPEKYKSSKLR